MIEKWLENIQEVDKLKKILFLLTTIFMLVVSCGSKSENKDSKELETHGMKKKKGNSKK